MKRLFLVTILATTLVMVAPVFVWAQQKEDLSSELKKASEITNTNERLSAYDTILEKYKIRTPSKTTSVGKWNVSVEVDPLYGNNKYIFTLTADSGSDRFNNPISLLIRCEDDTIEVFIAWRDYLGSDDTRVTIKLDDASPVTSIWSISTSGTSTFYDGDTVAFVKQLIRSKKLVARTTPYSSGPSTAIFDLNGLKESVRPYNSELQWF